MMSEMRDVQSVAIKNWTALLPWSAYILLALVLRLSIAQWPYSGKSNPPMYGDFEAQRHWMEVTNNLPMLKWYQNDTTVNNLTYWGLDYPPLTAYHSMLMGAWASARWNSSWVALLTSHGMESEELKCFMRYTVVLADCATYMPAAMFFFIIVLKDTGLCRNADGRLAGLLAAVFNPALIIIDHGHFQYNCVSLGLFVFSVSFYILQWHSIGSVCFCMALFYKQMELYHALPIFVYVISLACHRTGWCRFLCRHIAIVLSCTFLTFLPFHADLLQVLHRLLPVSRGLYEDKVANFWCLLSPIIKVQKLFPSNLALLSLCTLVTLLSVMPCLYKIISIVFIRPRRHHEQQQQHHLRVLLLSLTICSLGFFLFSYQVHEKSILLVLVPLSLLHPYALPWPAFEIFCSTALYSMWPLLLRDGLGVPSLTLLGGCLLLWRLTRRHETSAAKAMASTVEWCNLGILTVLAALCAWASPPRSLLFLFPQLLSSYCCVVFLIFYIFLHYLLFL